MTLIDDFAVFFDTIAARLRDIQGDVNSTINAQNLVRSTTNTTRKNALQQTIKAYQKNIAEKMNSLQIEFRQLLNNIGEGIGLERKEPQRPEPAPAGARPFQTESVTRFDSRCYYNLKYFCDSIANSFQDIPYMNPAIIIDREFIAEQFRNTLGDPRLLFGNQATAKMERIIYIIRSSLNTAYEQRSALNEENLFLQLKEIFIKS